MDPSTTQPVPVAFDSLIELRSYIRANMNEVPARFVNFCASNLMHSQAQLFQDLLVVFFLKGKKNGFFVEFGATDGVNLSNSFLLERQFEWKGLLAEPARCWHAALKANRKAIIDVRCVWRESGQKLDFKETAIAELSTVKEFIEKDFNSKGRDAGTNYIVDSISLNDLLSTHNCPRKIDYLSVDTEGSEFEILSRFDFGKYDVSIITVEHNYCDPDRQNIHDLLAAKGFVRIFDFLSKWDDWYIQRSIISQ